jgi:DNA (cytosine-5)-methyltransferase 1
VNYYNEHNPKAAAWLRELVANGKIPAGDVDDRSILEVRPHEIAHYTQQHFFAGIGGWSLALRMAGWPDDRPVRTGSCPCQPFSCAGKGKGEADERHLWPVFRDLITFGEPTVTFGEQVASKAGRAWLSGVRADLEGMGYAVGAADLCAAGIGAPHTRQRLYWVADAAIHGRKRIQRRAEAQVPQNRAPQTLDAWNGSGSPFEHWQKLLAESHVARMADGVPSTLDIRPRLHAYGNAIVPQLAAEFVMAFDDLNEWNADVDAPMRKERQ